MNEAPVDIPTSCWERVRADRRKLAAVLGAGALVLVLLGVLVAGFIGGREDDARDVAALDLPSVEGVSSDTTSSSGVTGTVDPGEGSDSGGTGADADVDEKSASGREPSGHEPSGDGNAVPRRAPYIAFRLDGVVVVAREDGSNPVPVIESPGGAFALSPDARSLALVESGELAIITVANGRRRAIGPADPHGVAWQADSAALYFMRGATGSQGSSEVWRIPVSGGSPVRVLQGGPPAVASDGTIAAPSAPVSLNDPSRGSLWVFRPGAAPSEVPVRGQAVGCAAEAGLIVYALYGKGFTDEAGVEYPIDPEIWTMRFDGTSQRRLVGSPTTSRPFGYAKPILSPDGTEVLYAEVGDDGYSRAYVISSTGGSPRPLTVRRDTYPIGWSSDGTIVFFVEGNAFQGEPTALMSVAPDGMGRRVIVEGAGL